ncbi:hypothetical protein D9613_002188 [Agrocybe pediades]|uniref:U3 small nucleolar RNA-associated protein 11 n=1 Tax=Agrocybe pediades TaxID=84607 RepID=A0A8H4VUE8_9AGAR|nr:hypothetical protein D9613_002188 [Agrocybe pediades]
MTSSLRNSIHRRNHKERSQLAHRSKLGLLEKHADYVKRARDYHSKKDRITRLKQKAEERNKDEFYFSMIKEKTQGGVHVKDRGNAAIPTDIVKVLKTQDENYVRTMRASGLKKIDKIKNSLMEMSDLVKLEDENINVDEELDEKELGILAEAKIIRADLKGKRKHVLFAENAEEASRLLKKGKGKALPEDSTSLSSSAVLSETDLGWKSQESKKKTRKRSTSSRAEAQPDADIEEDQDVNETSNKRRRLLKELSARLDRDRKLRYAEREFEMQRQMMGKGGRKKIQGVEKVEGDDDREEEDEDEIDARRGKRKSVLPRQVDEETYRPRVYKWRLERKR